MRVGAIRPADRLKSLREELNMTQIEFAKKLRLYRHSQSSQKAQVDTSKYNKWEKGKSLPNYDELKNIATRLDVTIDYLLGHSESRTEEHAADCDILGLTETAAECLRSWKHHIHYPFSPENPELLKKRLATVNALLEDEQIIDLLRDYFFDPISIQNKRFVYVKAYISDVSDSWKSVEKRDTADEKWQLPAELWSSSILFGMIQDKLQRMRVAVRERVEGE